MVELLSQVNHCMEVNNAAQYKSVWRFLSTCCQNLLKYHQDGSEWEAEHVFNPQRDSESRLRLFTAPASSCSQDSDTFAIYNNCEYKADTEVMFS